MAVFIYTVIEAVARICTDFLLQNGDERCKPLTDNMLHARYDSLDLLYILQVARNMKSHWDPSTAALSEFRCPLSVTPTSERPQ